MSRTCLNCEDWAPEIEKVNGPIVLWSIRAGRDLFNGKPFKFCPWCGAILSDISTEPAVTVGGKP